MICSAFLYDAIGGTLFKERITAGVECLPLFCLKNGKKTLMELKMHVGNMEYVDRFAEGIGFQV